MESPDIQQISLSLSVKRKTIAPARLASKTRQQRDVHAIRQQCVTNFGGNTPSFNIHERLAPFHICLSSALAEHIRGVHVALDRALINVVERWFSGEQANLAKSMPLERHEEDLLRWVDGPGAEFVPPFREQSGMWRTDYLVEGDNHTHTGVSIKICEINARIPFNGVWLIGSHGDAHLNSICKGDLLPFDGLADDFGSTKNAVFTALDSTLPLFHVHNLWPGVDSAGFLHSYHTQSRGRPVTHVRPTELRLEPDAHAPDGYRLMYHPSDGSEKAEIKQCTLELFQGELEEMDPILLRKLATLVRYNDLRTVLLTHDKRILGVLCTELANGNFVSRHVLTPAEAELLRAGIAETILPGSAELQLLQARSRLDHEERKNWIVKPARDAACRGIVLGGDMTQKEWLVILEEQAAKALRPSEGAVVVQRLASHLWFDIVRHLDTIDPPSTVSGSPRGHSSEHKNGVANGKDIAAVHIMTGGESSSADDDVGRFHLIGSHHVVNSRYNMFGPWRIGRKVHAGITGDAGGIVMATVIQPPGIGRTGEEEVERDAVG